jgi:hypothetical protein
MYKKPELQRLGSMQELTLGGGSSLIDSFGPNSTPSTTDDGCVPTAPGVCVSYDLS